MHGLVQDGPTKAGQVRKRTREQARKRAKTGPRCESRQAEYETVLRGHESPRSSNFICDI